MSVEEAKARLLDDREGLAAASVHDFVRRHPLATLAVALGAGVLLARSPSLRKAASFVAAEWVRRNLL